MQVKIANIRKEKARKNDTQMSKKGQTQRAIRTLEYKLDRVSDNLCNKILASTMHMHALYEFHFIVFCDLSCVLSHDSGFDPL